MPVLCADEDKIGLDFDWEEADRQTDKASPP